MKLTELSPCWLTFDGRRVGFIFRSPIKADWWQTCFVERFLTFRGRDGAYRSAHEGSNPDSQCGIVNACCPAAFGKWQPCNPDHQWTIAGGIQNANFDTLTVTPSLDGSAGGLWHGFVSAGQIVGGV